MFAAITVKYLGPTNNKGSRWKATCQCGSVTVPQDYSLNAGPNATAAAMALAKKVGWDDREWVGGQLHTGEYVFVITF